MPRPIARALASICKTVPEQQERHDAAHERARDHFVFARAHPARLNLVLKVALQGCSDTAMTLTALVSRQTGAIGHSHHEFEQGGVHGRFKEINVETPKLRQELVWRQIE